MLTRVGLVAEGDLASAFSEVLGLPLLHDDRVPLDALSVISIKESFLRDALLIPVECGETELHVATADPENEFAVAALAKATNRTVSLSIASVSQVNRTLDRWFGAVDAADGGEWSVDDVDSRHSETVDRLRDQASQAPVVRFVNSLFHRALETRASDIHVEPCNHQLRVRYRVDGMLKTVDSAAARLADAVVSRIKLMAKMNIAERRLPQDGRMHLRLQGIDVDVRVSTIPTVEGESVVLRILDQEKAELDLGSLGFTAERQRSLSALMQAPNGIVLVTGPTGSGKTTTLYSLLQLVNTENRKVVTIEDPVEYQIEGVNQIQVKPQIGLDFANALRSIVRQDPDVIMVGEMRDLETARIAVQSSLTGHLVLSTLHTNDAGSTITRLLDMGIEDYLVTSSVNAILAQRLVRTLCRDCRIPFAPSASQIEELGQRHARVFATLYRPAGCGSCDGSGYRGRTVIAELLVIDDTIRGAILEGADGKSLQQVALARGMVTLQQDGLAKAADGTTTIEEIARVTQLQ
jgi:general secretion pathway protein E